MNRTKKTMDGNNAAAHVSYAFTEVAAIYPITPSSVMADDTDKYSSSGRKNIFGQEVKVIQMQSEAGVAGAVHGSLTAGALTTTYTASQGLLLMIPNMYKIAGELLPCVIHASARTVSSHALSIFGDHSDVYACRQTGFAMLCSNSPQEVMDLSAIAHLSTIKGRVPFLHFFDGFRTSHELQKIEVWDYDTLGEMIDTDALNKFKDNALNPERPKLRGPAENDDIFFQNREACNEYYDQIPRIVKEYMDKVNQEIGSNYRPFNYYGPPDADRIIIAMGSVCETIEEVIDYLNSCGDKVGLIKVRLYRPFVPEYLLQEIPSSVKAISVIDRTKEPGSVGEPLYLDVVAALSGTKFGSVPIYAGRYGLSSKNTAPCDIIAIYKNMQLSEPKKQFTVGIKDDVTGLSLDVTDAPDTTPSGTYSCKFWGLGADGTVGANKNSIKIIGDYTNLFVQGYFAYDSKKSGGLTVSHLRFSGCPIKSTYYVSRANFVACHNPSYVYKYNMIEDLKPSGNFLLNCPWSEEELDKKLPSKMKKYIADNNINFYIIDGIKIGKELRLGGRINTILQSAFFKIAGIISETEVLSYMKDAATKSYGKKGQDVVKMNHMAIEKGMQELKKVAVPDSWGQEKISDDSPCTIKTSRQDLNDYVNKVMMPINSYDGNSIPVSAFKNYVDGTLPQGTSAHEKRGVAVDVPEWNKENCIQCNFCSYVCPHAVIRPAVLDAAEEKKAPTAMHMKPMIGFPDKKFAITVSVLDCTGCGSCAQVCPGLKGNKALVMKPIDTQCHQQAVFDFAKDLSLKPEVTQKFKVTTVKGSQFNPPLLEFSGACAGCGETPYARLVTQLFGDKMLIANATGCSSIWGGSAPSTPYTVNKFGRGPAWHNSLFEDNAEFGFGMHLAQSAIRDSLKKKVLELVAVSSDADLKRICSNYIETFNSSTLNQSPSYELVSKLQTIDSSDEKIYSLAKEILKGKESLSKKSVWIFGGDGWAYDIGFGGLDHVIASGADVNMLVFDTEVYSNTGGQASKATPTGSVAQFASAGKVTKKKDLASIAMSYGYVYVAQIAMGADYNQCLKVFHEAESYNGPSLIIAYSPCINHGIKGGMSVVQLEEKNAVLAGYWNLFRFDPRLKVQNKNPLIIDSKMPSLDYKDFILNEIRYSSLTRSFPERAEYLFEEATKQAKEKYERLLKMQKMYG